MEKNSNLKKVLIIGGAIIIIALLLVVFVKGDEKTTKQNTNNGTKITATESKQEENQKEEKKAEQVNLGETLENDDIKMSLDKIEVEKEYKFEHTEKTSVGTHTKKNGIDGKSGMKLVCLRGKLTNKTPNEVYTSNNFIKGEAIINGNTYKTTLKCFDVESAESHYTIVAQQEADYFLYAEVPESVADNIQTCVINFGNVKGLDSKNGAFIDKLTELDYLYTISK